MQELINRIRNRKPLEALDLQNADLCCADLSGANLSGANLHGAILCDTNLCRADLRAADLRGSDLCRADLCDADLGGANLCRADLSGANLRGAVLDCATLAEVRGNNREILTLHTGQWIVVISPDQIAIGCKQYSIEEWFSFNDDVISKMNPKALDFWRVWGPILKQIITNRAKGKSCTHTN